jgi:hypothetical protein
MAGIVMIVILKSTETMVAPQAAVLTLQHDIPAVRLHVILTLVLEHVEQVRIVVNIEITQQVAAILVLMVIVKHVPVVILIIMLMLLKLIVLVVEKLGFQQLQRVKMEIVVETMALVVLQTIFLRIEELVILLVLKLKWFLITIFLPPKDI